MSLFTQAPRIAVIFGGHSSEYEISLKSAYSVLTHMNREKYEAVAIGITREGEWFHFRGPYQKILEDSWQNPEDCIPAIISPDRRTNGILVFGEGATRKISIDAAMPMLHGRNGEDGTIQGLLELAGITIIGCNTLSSALCMDKSVAHKLVSLAGIKVPKSLVLQNEADFSAATSFAEEVGFPLFVKPVNGGSSFGITRVETCEELPKAIKLAFEHDNSIIIEENIEGFEVGCAILGRDELFVGEVDEIELLGGFLGCDEKNTLSTTTIHAPARIAADKAHEIKEIAKVIYRALGCSGFARVDMFLTPAGEIVFNEVNTIPGFMPHSRYPNMLKAAGMTLEGIVGGIIEAAMPRRNAG
ncbi:MAG: D-alanine--D-serine ligase VanG [Clostridiales bacterium]|nr:D-alanine--D-serine ligase VanG [Clostridiales bacterium]